MRLRKGAKALIVCPSEYAYGEQGHPPAIPPNSTLKFEVELLHFSMDHQVNYNMRKLFNEHQFWDNQPVMK